MKAGGLTSVVTKAPIAKKIKPADNPTDKPADNTKSLTKPEKKTEPSAPKEDAKKSTTLSSKKPETAAAESANTDKQPTAKVTQTKPSNSKPSTEEKKEPAKPVFPAKTTSLSKDEPQKKIDKPSSGTSAPKTLKGKKKNEETSEDVAVPSTSDKPTEESKEVFIPEPSS